MMAVLLFMFQFSQVMRESWNHYTHNEYAVENPTTAEMAWDINEKSDLVRDKIPNVLLIGQQDSEIGKMVSQWCNYTKYKMNCKSELARYSGKGDVPSMVLIDGESVAYPLYLFHVDQYLKKGVPVVFVTLPDVETMKNVPKLQELMGIEDIPQDTVTLEGIRLFSGALLGGEAIYKIQSEEEAKLQDLDLDIPWYVTGKGSKTYMTGLLDETKYDREKFPRIIWRNSIYNSMVFAVNGDYMKDETAFGMLDLFLYELSDYVIYPVINAQNTSMVDFPDFSGADEEAVTALYSRDAQAVQQDVFWPSIYSMITRNNLKTTCFFMTQYDADAQVRPGSGQLDFYLQQLNEVGGEAGRSLHHGERMTLEEKVAADSQFYQEEGCRYDFHAAYLERITAQTKEEWETSGTGTGISTITGPAEDQLPLVSYYTDTVTLQSITHEAEKYSYAENLRTRSLLTSIGYTNMLIDFHRVLWPEQKEDAWEVYFDKIYSNISTYWSHFAVYDQTTLSQSDGRVRTFLNLDYSYLRNDYMIYLSVRNGGDDCWFLLRTHGEKIDQIQNAEYRMLEEDAYLIHVLDNHASITLEDADNILKYNGPFGR